MDGSQFTTPIDFFRLFFSYELLMELCGFTNVYFEKTSHLKPSYSERWLLLLLMSFIIILLYYFICPLLQLLI